MASVDSLPYDVGYAGAHENAWGEVFIVFWANLNWYWVSNTGEVHYPFRTSRDAYVDGRSGS